MVQEFQVLRCFSCETFQVQQVKKSKTWNCKMCGEKQSLIKEYGRGSGADCRRHVQKLNSLRGELLEAEQERAWVKWEKDECKKEDSFDEEVQSCGQQGEVQAVSRWSKYVDQTDSGLRDDEHDEEEENVYTERTRFRVGEKISSKKRKKSFTLKGTFNTVYEHEDTGADSAHRGAKRLAFQARQHGGSLNSSAALGHSSEVTFTSTNPKTSASAIHASPSAASHGDMYCGISAVGVCGANKQLSKAHHSSVSSSSFFAPSSFSQTSTETKQEAAGSKWARFLSFVDEDKTEMSKDAQISSQGPDGEDAHSSPAQRSAIPVPTVTQTNKIHLSCEESVCAKVPLDAVTGMGKGTASVFEKLSENMTGTTSNNSFTFAPKFTATECPMRNGSPPSQRSCPVLSFSTIFHTDEDFDDSI